MAEEAAYALVGVVTGGVLSGAVDWFNDWRRGRRDVRVAAREVHDELAWVAAAIEQSLKQGTPGSIRQARVDLVDVRSATAILRRSLSTPEWVQIRAAERRIQILQHAYPSTEEADLGLTPDDVEFATASIANIRQALSVLGRHMG